MQIDISFEGLKKAGLVLFAVMGIFSFGSSLHYVRFRHQSQPFFDVLAFDMNSRKDEIRSRYQKEKADEAEALHKALQKNDETPKAAVPQPKKKP